MLTSLQTLAAFNIYLNPELMLDTRLFTWCRPSWWSPWPVRTWGPGASARPWSGPPSTFATRPHHDVPAARGGKIVEMKSAMKNVCVFAARKEGKMGKVNERKVAQSITSQHWLVVACCVAARSCLWPLADVMNILLEWPMKQIVKVVTKGSWPVWGKLKLEIILQLLTRVEADYLAN